MGGRISIGIGGWVHAPWRGTFYPAGLKQKDELAWLGQHLTATEINATYYSTQKPATFANWAKAVPDGFRFAVKASRYCTNRRVLADAGDSVAKFVDQGIAELGDRLGPILWQFMPTKAFDPADFGAFWRCCLRALRVCRCVMRWKFGMTVSMTRPSSPWRNRPRPPSC